MRTPRTKRTLALAGTALLISQSLSWLMLGSSVFIPRALAVAPTCDSTTATIYVDGGFVVGGPNNGVPYNAGITELLGTSGIDVVVGTADGDIIRTLGNNDTVCALGGNDTVNGGSGSNHIELDAGDNTLQDGNGNDTVTGGDGNNNVTANGGANSITLGHGNNIVNTGNGNDTIIVGNGTNTINAGGGTNNISTGNGTIVITSGNGNDTIVTGSGNDDITAGGGSNDINSNAGHDIISTGNGNDTINTGDGNDQVFAQGGSNDVTLGAGNDAATGGNGTDHHDGGPDQDYCDTGNGAGDTEVNCEQLAGAFGVITIVKDAVPNDVQDFSYTGTYGSFSLDDDADGTLSNSNGSVKAVGSYTSIEGAPAAGWALTSLVCNDSDAGTAVAASTATIDLDQGQSITCVFTNTHAQVCGDNFLQSPEQCDDGNVANSDGCSETCQIEASAVCGNGLIEGSETCDDSNTNSSDGCSSSCATENGWQCSGQPSVCTQNAEVCDGIDNDGDLAVDEGFPDTDGDLQADCVDSDDDGDGIPDAQPDNCPLVANSGQEDFDGDTIGDACDAPVCGNGFAESGEQCDDGNVSNTDSCLNSCILAVCGDTFVQPSNGEQCDDGNIANGDGCSAICQIEGGTCVEPSDIIAHWKFDEGSGSTAFDSTPNNHDGTLEGAPGPSWSSDVPTLSVPNPYSLFFDGTDDQVRIPTDPTLLFGTTDFSVSLFAKTNAGDRSVLGNFGSNPAAYRGYGLYFYNANSANFFGYGDGGTNDAAQPATILDNTWHSVIGVYKRSGSSLTIDTYVDGSLAGTNAAVVGDITSGNDLLLGKYLLQPNYLGLLDDIRIFDHALTAPEIADLSAGECPNGSPGAVCGDNAIDGGEACDDGNTNNSDGCSSVCAVEGGWSCDQQEPSVCAPICGDGLVDGAEQCDDGDLLGGDGCSATCSVESGWSCDLNEPSQCTIVCGDGIVTVPETCDEGGLNGTANHCNLTCNGVTPSVCGNAITEAGEQCDDGNVNNNDGCSATCQTEPLICNGLLATIYVQNGVIVGGPQNGQLYMGTLNGGPGNDVIVGDDGPNTVNGNGGNDTICGMGGPDRLFGNAGNDWIHGGTGPDNVQGGGDNDTVIGGAEGDTMTGDSGADIACGGDGGDTIQGGSGNDKLDAGPGFDSLNGGLNTDECYLGETNPACESIFVTPLAACAGF